MPVYLLTAHAYRSWKEDDPRGYVQRGEGLKRSSERLARWRAMHAKQGEARFETDLQVVAHEVAVRVARDVGVRLHGVGTCPTHVHSVVSFGSPACTCGARELCLRDCAGKRFAGEVMTRMKRKMGRGMAVARGVSGRKWFSRGWDVKRVKDQEHLDYLLDVHLPDHEATQGGVFRRYT